MAIIYKKFRSQIIYLFPIILLYFLSITEIDTQFSNHFEILSFNLQLIIVYFWTLKNMNVLGNGHVFFAGIINDVIMGLPMGTSAMTYLSASFVALYIKNVTVKMTIFTDWFTFLIAIFFSNLVYYILIHNFSDLSVTYTYLFYNSLFTFLFFPLFWFFFTWYIAITGINRDD
tara:strand:- start:1537 stop:2055 length:519 start_codon:yes stop_codon:yes gene_type:complete